MDIETAKRLIFGKNAPALPGKGEIYFPGSVKGTQKLDALFCLAEYLGSRMDPGSGVQIREPEDARDAWAAHCQALMEIGDGTRERLGILWLSKNHRVLHAEVLFEGTIDSAIVYPRELVKRALQIGASACILTHNHPSGDPTPSSDDRRMTLLVKQAMEPIGVALLDHIVCGNPGTMSMSRLGWI